IVLGGKIKTVSLKKEKKVRAGKIDDLVLKRASFLRQARMELKKRRFKEAASLYQHAADISLKLDDEEANERFSEKARELKMRK
ncbi:MAG: hypothetical protein ACXQS8_07230, partial [Candidatus Helarchaeales archaeon]